VPKPVPRKRDVLIRIHAAAVTVSDVYIRSGVPTAQLWFRVLSRLAVGLRRPRRSIIGMVMAGEIEAIGSGVTRFRVGDRVYGSTIMRMGCYAEYTRIPAKGGVLAPAPRNLTHEEAAAIPYGGLIAWHFLSKADIRPGQHVLVYGASGAIGTAAVQIAKHFGAQVTGVCSGVNTELVRSLGADAVLDYTKEDTPPPGARYDLVFDAVGRRKTSALKVACIAAVAPERYLSVDKGMPVFRRKNLLRLTELVEAGVVRPVIDKRYPLEEIAEAQRYVELRHKKGNVVIAM